MPARISLELLYVCPRVHARVSADARVSRARARTALSCMFRAIKVGEVLCLYVAERDRAVRAYVCLWA